MVMQEARGLVVPEERFAAAKTYEQYIDSIAVNREKFADNLAGARVPDDLAARLRALVARPDGPKKLLVIGEDWCPDVYRGLPVAKKIADAACGGAPFQANRGAGQAPLRDDHRRAPISGVDDPNNHP